MKYVKIIVLIFAFPLFLYPLSSNKSSINQYSVKNWTMMDGLPQDSVTCITQDKKEYIWVATQNGFARFNGLEFKLYNSKNIPELKSNNIVNLSVDNENNIWVSTKQGLLFFDNKNNKLFTKKSGLYSNIISTTLNQDNDTWVGTSNGLNLIKNNKVVDFKGSLLLQNKYIYSLIQKGKDIFYIATNKGFFKLYNGEVKEILFNDKSIKISNFIKRKNGDILVNSWSKIFILKDSDKLEEFGKNLNLKLKPALYMIEDSSENLWITSRLEQLLTDLTQATPQHHIFS